MGEFIWPVPGFGRVTSGFRTAERPGHFGIDIGRELDPPRAIDGACIVAAAAGTVAAAHAGHPSMGCAVELDHGGGYATRYMHCSAVLVRPGQEVGRGEAIARVGSTGRSTAPHLHFEVLYRGAHLDPLGAVRPPGAAGPAAPASASPATAGSATASPGGRAAWRGPGVAAALALARRLAAALGLPRPGPGA